jgi:NAD-dependent deacetylase
MDQARKLQSYIDQSDNIVFFGGAGVSTESGIPDFRSADGLYSQKYRRSPEEMLSRPFFDAHKREFFEFYKEKVLALDAAPNAAHTQLAQLEASGKLKAVITQNIDGLHQKAGSENVVELHGSVYRNYCLLCGKGFSAQYIKNSPGVPACACGGAIKPDVVLYGEGLNPDVIARAIGYIRSCQMLIIGGTSLVVYPAAGLVDYFGGRHLVVINKSEIPERRANLFIQGSIGQVLSGMRVRPAGG